MNSFFSQEIKQGKRFEFGQNWQNYLSVLNEERIVEAEHSLKQMLTLEGLAGKNFLDIGSGSGLFSLAARRLGAKVYSFDYDPASVACTQELKRLYYPEDLDWTISKGSVLDIDYLISLGQFDIVYSWGVLHHTGNIWKALENVDLLVRNGGLLFISIYNDQGNQSKRWRFVKQIYCSSFIGKVLLSTIFISYRILVKLVIDILRLRNPIKEYTDYQKSRGMSWIYDWFDWLGGLPFEVAKPEEIFNFYKTRGYSLEKLKTCAGGHGCNEFVFTKQIQS